MSESNKSNNSQESNFTKAHLLTVLLAASTIALLASTIFFALKDESDETQIEIVTETILATARPPVGDNPCLGTKPDLPDIQCVIDEVQQTGEQSGTNVTKGYKGDRESDAVPITVPFFQAGLCPVNVHWHLGTEHLSVGEYDETGTGPSNVNEHHRGLEEETRQGFQCKYYEENDPKFTNPYEWKHCHGMEVG